MEINIPQMSLVLLVGPSGAGKSHFARRFFKATEIISSDHCRAVIADDESDQSATKDAFELLHFWAGKRLKAGRMTVIDATNVQKEARKSLVELAREYHVIPVAIVFDLPESVCQARNLGREDRQVGEHVIRQQSAQMRKSIRGLGAEGFRHIHVLKSEAEVAAVEGISRTPLYNDKRHEQGPFDIIGDVHGCFEELQQLLQTLGYVVTQFSDQLEGTCFEATAPYGRKLIFLGDLVDRGPDSPKVLRLVMDLVHLGMAYCVPGNHDFKLQQWLSGKRVQLKHGLEQTVLQLKDTPIAFKRDVERFIYGLVSHYVFDSGNLVVAHAGMLEEMQGRGSAAVRAFAMYGETTGEIDAFGLPVRYNWATNYRGKALVVYGHTPVPRAEWLNGTIDIDTGCVFGGQLTAMRYPEKELVSVPAARVYCEPIRPIAEPENPIDAQQAADQLLNIADVSGKRRIHTRLKGGVQIQDSNAIAALEVMSRWAIDPRWLIYLPPTMAPCATSDLPEFLEHPAQAFHYYAKRGVKELILEKKHMGSRFIAVICKDQETVRTRFGLETSMLGVCYTRTGRPFFESTELEAQVVDRLRTILERADFWGRHETQWVCLDCEWMPWNAKAQGLIQSQYASVGAAASAALPEVQAVLEQAGARGITEAATVQAQIEARQSAIQNYIGAYRAYCWDAHSLDDYQIAPFHILATEGKVHIDSSHTWHLSEIALLSAIDPHWLIATEFMRLNLDDEDAIEQGTQWWLELTATGAEGMVVKPESFVTFRKEGLIQPAIKCRGREYLRLIYGAEYTLPGNIERLKARSLGRKQALALQEFALGIEALERFVKREPLRKVHECVFGVLALESEEIDPRL